MNKKLLTLLFVYSIFSFSFADFELPADLYQGTDPKEIVVSDLNSDGKNDIVFVDNGKIQVLYQKNSFSFTDSQFSAILDGNDECFNSTSVTGLSSNDFTVSSWFNFGDSILLHSGMTLVGFEGNTGFEIKLNTISNLIIINVKMADSSTKTYYNSPGVNFPWTPSTNTWYNLVFTHNASSGQASMYLNTQKIYTWSGAAAIQTGSNIAIGCKAGAANTHFGGYIDEVAYFNTALSDPEVSEIYNFGKPTNLNNHTQSSSLVSWWTMGDHDDDNFNSAFGPKLLKDVIGSNDLTPLNTELEDKSNVTP